MTIVEAAGDANITTLQGYIEGSLDLESYQEQKEILKGALDALVTIGGHTSIGLGWIREIKHTVRQIPRSKPAKQKSILQECQVTLRVRAELPIFIGDKNPMASFRESKKKIPGAVMKAALARRITLMEGSDFDRDVSMEPPIGTPIKRLGDRCIVKPATRQSAFYTLRENFRDLEVSDFLPMEKNGEEMTPGRVLPITAYVCAHPQMCPGGGVPFDILRTLLATSAWRVRCPYCHGQARRADELSGAVSTRIHSKSAVSSYFGTMKDESIHRLRALLPGTEWSGTIRGVFDPAELERLVKNGLWVGAKITSGFGKVSVQTIAQGPAIQESGAHLMARCLLFQEALDLLEDRVVITTQSDTILSPEIVYCEDNEAYLESLSNALFPRTMFFEKEIKLRRVFAQYEYEGGYDTSYKEGLRKRLRLRMKAGAVMVLEICKKSSYVWNAFADLVRWGLGEDQVNGYGQIVIADPFHLPKKGENK
jgi:hypothetical protein